MISKLIPVVFLALGLAAGVGAGLYLVPEPEKSDDAGAETSDEAPKDLKKTSKEQEKTAEFIKLHSQFVVPVIRRNEISALVVMSLSLETQPGLSEVFYAREPKLRDVFLQTLFDHSNMGGFDGAFTSATALDPLRVALLEVARQELGSGVLNVLITDLARQDT